MNKKYLPLLIIGAVIILGAGGYFLLNANKSLVPSNVKEAAQEQLSSGKNSIKGLLSSSVPQKCTFSDENSQGTVYVSSGKVRGDFETTTDSKKTMTHVIINENSLYGWTDGTSAGYKMAFDPKAMEDKGESMQKDSQDSVDVSKEADYNCSPWVVDGGQFNPPSGVTFQDYSSLMPQASGSPTGASMNCATCAGLSGDNKAECLALFKCSQ